MIQGLDEGMLQYIRTIHFNNIIQFSQRRLRWSPWRGYEYWSFTDPLFRARRSVPHFDQLATCGAFGANGEW